MLIKYIRCHVPYASQTHFSQAQEAWEELASSTGFIAQLGGFSGEHAHILSIWESKASHQIFMDTQHDRIATAQQGDYHSLKIAFFDLQFEMPSPQYSTLLAALQNASYLRLADCLVIPKRSEHFIDVQKSIWHSGMAPFILAGAFWKNEYRFLVTTLWESKAAHQRYLDVQFPHLQKMACCEEDILTLDGVHLALIPEWTLLTNQS
jgi:heme-degrading monooxygenase HmoA